MFSVCSTFSANSRANRELGADFELDQFVGAYLKGGNDPADLANELRTLLLLGRLLGRLPQLRRLLRLLLRRPRRRLPLLRCLLRLRPPPRRPFRDGRGPA